MKTRTQPPKVDGTFIEAHITIGPDHAAEFHNAKGEIFLPLEEDEVDLLECSCNDALFDGDDGALTLDPDFAARLYHAAHGALLDKREQDLVDNPPVPEFEYEDEWERREARR